MGFFFESRLGSEIDEFASHSKVELNIRRLYKGLEERGEVGPTMRSIVVDLIYWPLGWWRSSESKKRGGNDARYL